MKYRIDFSGAGGTRTADSYAEALAITRQVLGVNRIYKGAEYYTRIDESGYEAMEFWRSRNDATRESGAQAPAVVACPSKW